ncbi:MAG: hypothetical protein KDB80_16125 [Planctomycetes bacterium]|nr:hypothetical protein [Planctomycetota bacterium]
MKRTSPFAAVLSCALLSACGTIELVPMRGPKPRTILIVPLRRAPSAAEMHELVPAFGRAIAARGYDVVPEQDATRRLASLGWRAEAQSVIDLPLRALADEPTIDAVWIVDVDRWRFVDGPGRPFEFDLTCSLVSTADESLLWVWRFDGSERSLRTQKGVDPFVDRDPFQAENPVPWVVRTDVVDAREMSELVARSVALRLPTR